MCELWQDKNHQTKAFILIIHKFDNLHGAVVIINYVTKLIQTLHTVMLCYHWLLSTVFTCVHAFLYFPVFPGISHRGIGQGLSLDRAVFPGNYRPGISRISKPMFTLVLVLVLVLGVSVLDVLEYLIGENAKYLYLYLITSTWSIWVLDQLYLTPTLVGMWEFELVESWLK